MLWSPTWWTRYGTLSAATRSTIAAHVGTMLHDVPHITWVHVQDHLGADPTFTCTGDAIPYYQLLRGAAPGLASLAINMEYFTTTPTFMTGSATEHAARERCYASSGIPIGASFELRYWRTSHVVP
jgi:hypothetical protein